MKETPAWSHQLLDEIIDPARTRFVALPFPGTNRRTKTAKETAEDLEPTLRWS